MKNKLLAIIVIFVILLSSTTSWYMSRSTIYPETGVIVKVVETENNTYEITFDVANENRFYFFTESSDYFVGDIISLIMDSKGTEIVYDDEIYDHKYSGTIDMYKLDTINK